MFDGERWTSHSESISFCDDKSLVAHEFDVRLAPARDGKGFSRDCIHYGQPQPSSGFQAVNLALLFGAAQVVLVGFDSHAANGKHFFGDHPDNLKQCPDDGYREFAKSYPSDDRIVNATPGSAIKAYQFVDLEEVLRDSGMRRHGAVSDRGEYRNGSA